MLHAAADQARGVYDGLDFVGGHCLDEGRQVANVLAQNLEAFVAELEPEEFGSGLQVDEDNLLAAPQRLARE